MIANYGTGTAQEAADWVRYANKTQHYGVKYWEIGNENYGNGHYGSAWEADDHTDKSPSEYAANVIAYSRAMKAVDPDIIDPSSVQSPAGAVAVRNGALSRLRGVTADGESTWLFGGLLVDEWATSSTFVQNDETDQRQRTRAQAIVQTAANVHSKETREATGKQDKSGLGGPGPMSLLQEERKYVLNPEERDICQKEDPHRKSKHPAPKQTQLKQRRLLA